MPYYFFLWTPEIESHLAEHGISPHEFEEVVGNPDFCGISRSSGNPLAIGTTEEGRRLCCIFRLIDADSVEPITAYELSE
jgi:hypothetical protein